MAKVCKLHGRTEYIKRKDGYWRCRRCSIEAVKKRREKVKRQLVKEHGGQCTRCGYSKCLRALEFHHRDRTLKDKSITVSQKGWTLGINRLREELKKCDLLCANCHREVEEDIYNKGAIA